MPIGRDERAPEARDEIADKGRGDHHRPRADHADRDRDQELPLDRASRYCCTSPCSRNGTITRPLPKVSEPAFRKNSSSLPRIEPESRLARAGASDGHHGDLQARSANA